MFSWDEGAGTYDTDYSNGRSYISVVSEVIVDPDEDCEGYAKNDMGEARMDIVSSEIGYLGYQASESYGLTWKVRILACLDESKINVGLFKSPIRLGNASPPNDELLKVLCGRPSVTLSEGVLE